MTLFDFTSKCRLDHDNYTGDVMQKVAFLLGNKSPETFRLEIDHIRLELIISHFDPEID